MEGRNCCRRACGSLFADPPLRSKGHQATFIAALRALALLWTVQFTTAVVLGLFISKGHRLRAFHGFGKAMGLLTNGFLGAEVFLAIAGFLLGARCFQQVKTTAEVPALTTALHITYVRTIRLLPMLVIACLSVALFSPGIAPLASCKWLSLWTGPLFVSNSVVPADRQCLPWLWPLQPLAMAHFIVPLVPVAAYRLARSRMLNFKPACTLLLATLLVLTEAPNLFFSSSDIPQLDLWELGPVLSWPHTRYAWFLRVAPCLAGALAATSVYCPTTLGRADLRLAYKWQSPTRNTALVAMIIVTVGVGGGDWLALYVRTKYHNLFLVVHRLVFTSALSTALALMHRAPLKLRQGMACLLRRTPIMFLSRISYPTLLVHPVAVYSVISWVGVRDNISTVQFVGLTVATTAASVALGTLYYACFEYHWLVSKLWYRVRGADYRDLHIADATSASVAGSAANYRAVAGTELTSIAEEGSNSPSASDTDTDTDTDTDSSGDDSDDSAADQGGAADLEAGGVGGAVMASDGRGTRDAGGGVGGPLLAPVTVSDPSEFQVFRRVGVGGGDASEDDSGSGTGSDVELSDEGGSSGGVSADDVVVGEVSELALLPEDWDALDDAGTSVADLAMEVLRTLAQLPTPTLADVASVSVDAVEAVGGSDALTRRVIAVVVDMQRASS